MGHYDDLDEDEDECRNCSEDCSCDTEAAEPSGESTQYTDYLLGQIAGRLGGEFVAEKFTPDTDDETLAFVLGLVHHSDQRFLDRDAVTKLQNTLLNLPEQKA